MTVAVLIELFREALLLGVVLSLPMLLIGMVIGVLISVLQTATSIQEQSLSFIPKLLATVATIIVLSPWLLARLMQFTQKLLSNLQNFAR